MNGIKEVSVVSNGSLIYKGVEFDYYSYDDLGSWSGICESCLKEHGAKIKDSVQINSSGGVCGVKGCFNSDWNNMNVYYIVGLKE